MEMGLSEILQVPPKRLSGAPQPPVRMRPASRPLPAHPYIMVLLALVGFIVAVTQAGAAPQDDPRILSGASPLPDAIHLGEPPLAPSDLSGLSIPEAGRAGPSVSAPQAGQLSVAPADREQSRAFFNTYYLNASQPAIDWSGSRSLCSAGTTALDFKDAVALRINYYRAMAGVPAQITLVDAYSSKNQEAALMMSVNQTLSHSPPTGWTCYTSSGAEAAGNSNLALGIYGWDAIDGYMKDPGDGNGAAGHRRWILYPQTQNMGTGDIPDGGGWGANSLWVFDSHLWEARPPTREEFVAWPPPGFVPYQVVHPRWSFAYPGADFSQSSVTMSTGQGNIVTTLETVKTGYGENTLVWIPQGMKSGDSWPQPSGDTDYHVTLSNVLIQGLAHSFVYDVRVMDPAAAGLLLSVSASGNGSGTVSPVAVNSGATYGYGTSVTLTATASTGSVFAGWSGEGCVGTGTCTVVMTQARSVTATFTLSSPHILSITVAGSGGGMVTASPGGISCTGSCAASYASGAQVALTASAGPGATFREWRGDACSGSTSSPCQVTMNAAKFVTAVFSQTFTDATLAAGVTPVKAVHLTELRTAINALRSHYGLGAFSWSQAPPAPGGLVLKTHLTDLRTAMDQAYTKAGKTHASYTDPGLAAGTTIRAAHLSDLRSDVRSLE
jgi:hypothetical protein